MPERTQILDVKERRAFSTIYEAINWCVGTDYKYWGRACWPNVNPTDGFRIWFTQLAYVEHGQYVPAVKNCLNLLCCNGNYHVFDYIGPTESEDKSEHNWKYDLIFSKEVGGNYYFRGVFVGDYEHSAPNHHVSKRISTKVKLIGCPARRLDFLNSVAPGEFDVDYLKHHNTSFDVVDVDSKSVSTSTNNTVIAKPTPKPAPKAPTRKTKIYKYSSSKNWDSHASYRPLFTIINKKLYRTNSWNELFQMLLFSYCYKTDNMTKINEDIELRRKFYNSTNLIAKGIDESTRAAKFAPDLCVRVFFPSSVDCEALGRIQYYIGKNVDVYIVEHDRNADKNAIEEQGNAFISNFIKETGIRNGSTKHLIAHINGKVLSDKEKFYRRIEKEFDRTTLIGDIDISSEEEWQLKKYMLDALDIVAFGNGVVSHPKIFAFGLVRYAMKHYESKTFWPFLKQEYGISIPGVNQWRVNEKFKDIMQENNKLYDDCDNNYIHNICMHAFVCDKYAYKFFDYMFDFWRLDLSRSLENCIDDNGNNLFDILIEEVANGGQDIKLHTSMALKMNPKGCKNRFRRVLRMIDNCYWNDADYSSSRNRITVLFNKWKNDPKSSFAKEIAKTTSSRRGGRGEKLLSRPTIVFSPSDNSFKLHLPKQVLRGCSEDENPYWSISVRDKNKKVLANLLRGKAFLFTEEMSIKIDKEDLFEEINIKLSSENGVYYRRTIKKDDLRFFNSKLRNIDSYEDYITKDVSYILVKKDNSISYVNGSFETCDKSGDDYDLYLIEPSVGDILILPNNHALSFGQPLVEGIISEHRIDGVKAIHDDVEYRTTSHLEKLFFKCSKQKIKGTSIKVLHASEQIYFGRAIDNDLLEFKLDDNLDDIYGYIIDLNSFIKDNGIYSLQLSIPGYSVRTYNICYINGFGYNFIGAPYIFKDFGTIEFPKNLLFKTNKDWVIEANKNYLEFSIVESEREINKYVKDRKLKLEYMFSQYSVDMIFDLPVLYWKYDVNDAWYTQKPGDVMIKTLPKKIYIAGDLSLSNAKMRIGSFGELDDSEIGTNYDKENGVYFFRTVDIIAALNRDLLYRNLRIIVNDQEETFLRIVCRSDVRSQSISGDFKKKKIYGYFDIFGDSDYMVTIKRGDKVIEEDIPLKDGKFEVDCDVEEGFYSLNLYEIEDDDSGFGSISYKLGEYSLEVIDERNFNGKNLVIKYIRNRNKLLSDLQLNYTYVVKELRKVDYFKDIGEGNIYTWLYDPYDNETMSSFEYFFGQLGSIKNGEFGFISKAVVIIDNDQNMNEVIINMINDGCYEGMKYFPKRGSLICYESNLTKSGRRMLKMIDDDIYQVGVEIGGKI